MTATITRLPVSAPQPAPSVSDATASFTVTLYEAAFAAGERSVYERLGIPCPPQRPHLKPAASPAQRTAEGRVLSAWAAGDAAAARQPSGAPS